MSERRTIQQADGYSPIHMWVQDGETWACAAADHNAFCFLCQRADELLLELIQHCEEGNMLARAKPDGSFEFKMTVKGTAAAENLIHNDPEMASMWAQLQAKGPLDA